MKVFISWSGEQSKLIADIFYKWIPAVIQAAKPFFSPDDILKGTKWNIEISKELNESKFGLIFLTSDNLNSPWILFEAGALSNKLTVSKVCPIIFGINTTDIQGPLIQFQNCKFEKSDILKLIKSLNSELGEIALVDNVLVSVFEKWWPDLKKDIENVIEMNTKLPIQPIRNEKDILSEILALTRSIAQNASLTSSARQIIEKTALAVSIDLDRWPSLLQKGQAILSDLGETLTIKDASNENFPQFFREKMNKLGIEHNSEIQVHIINESQIFVYHDWEKFIGHKAIHGGVRDRLVYEEMFAHECGAVAWSDNSSNVSQDWQAATNRFNIAFFRPIKKSNWRIVVEMHQEIRR